MVSVKEGVDQIEGGKKRLRRGGMDQGGREGGR